MCNSMRPELLGPALVSADVLSPAGGSEVARWTRPGSSSFCFLQSCHRMPPSQGRHIWDHYVRIKMLLGETPEILRLLQKLSCNL